MNFGKIITAMVTPFNEFNQVDVEATKRLIEHLIDNGSDAIVVGGTTGESPTLTTDEKLLVFKTAVDCVNGRIPVIAGTGSNSTKASIELTEQATKLGVDAVMLVAPYYNRPSQEGLYQHFKAIAETTALPVMLYNVPGRSSVSIDVETTLRLADIPNIVSMKEASEDLDAMALLIEHAPKGFTVYSGDDSLTLPILSIGGAGVVSVASHIFGNEMQQMISSFEHGQIKEAASIHRQLLPGMKALFAAPNPVPVKAALEMYQIRTGSVRLPLLPLTGEQEKVLRQTLEPIWTATYVS
ncbi:4-hydroxy-tetrahydrodipicolinate synthase [Alkalicoccobacillus porphyridii]|uniref:4-hydroxy-tetrahydrodipicolinate synthase n=1 Tax=Alkalicoccobacillus porphyridii TaxID=2597270 RepID=A0A553ZZW6_9BACI|nr:4-hydroxy-tetrahydrodipicolinate synthase [Alkalicoccobacillus porphyridii]TSB46981.1 4-hydroxy-tetrahydrodipicolinate synthase [Alkalicoccobacillus porphyridii]